MSTAVEVRGLEKRYGNRVALDGIEFSIETGEIFGLLGPNGAGKTTTVEILEGYRTADAGTVTVLGRDPWRGSPELRAEVGVMLQEGGLYPGLRPLELLALYAAFYADPEDPDELIDRVGLREVVRTPIRRLSGGQAQRLSLAAAVIGRPRLVFLDEPTAGMDPRARADTWTLVRALRDRGTTVVLTTHYMDEAEQLCDRLAILDRGQIAAVGTPHEVTTSATEPMIRFTASGTIDPARLADGLGVPVTSDAHEYSVLAPPSPVLIARLTEWLAAEDLILRTLRTGHASLEEVFLRLTAEPEATTAGASNRRRRGPR